MATNLRPENVGNGEVVPGGRFASARLGCEIVNCLGGSGLLVGMTEVGA